MRWGELSEIVLHSTSLVFQNNFSLTSIFQPKWENVLRLNKGNICWKVLLYAFNELLSIIIYNNTRVKLFLMMIFPLFFLYTCISHFSILSPFFFFLHRNTHYRNAYSFPFSFPFSIIFLSLP